MLGSTARVKEISKRWGLLMIARAHHLVPQQQLPLRPDSPCARAFRKTRIEKSVVGREGCGGRESHCYRVQVVYTIAKKR